MKPQPLTRRIAVQAALGVALCLGGLGAAHAQMNYPMGSLLGNASFGAFPQVSINCTDYTLGPGARVLSPLRRIIPHQQLGGIQSPVVFQTDAMGNVFRIWLVKPEAAAQLQVPRAPGQCGLFFSN
ncbi:MAG: hypothetical protein PHO64_11700 [Thiomonas sp.]|nr:hypothetical protein [Thiomonas sp.]